MQTRIPSRAQIGDALWALLGAVPVLSAILYVIDAEHFFALTSIGSTAVLLFAAPEAPASQPLTILVSHMMGAVIGLLLLHSVGNHAWSMALGVALTAVLMKMFGIMHPPAGANPMIVLNIHAGWMFLLDPLWISLLIVGVGAFVWSRLRPGQSWPVGWTS